MARLILLMLLSPTLVARDWVTVKGTIIWPNDKPMPGRTVIDTKGMFIPGGPLLTDNLIIDAKQRGLKNVWVYLRPDTEDRNAVLKPEEIQPALRKPEMTVHTVDAPCCQFEPKVLALRSGDKIEWKNTSPVGMSWKIDADDPSPSFAVFPVPVGGFIHKDPFVAQKTPGFFSCSIHPWMQGQFMVFDHPYFAVTDDHGKFEIKNCPAGKYRLVYRHEHGYHKGKDGRFGWPVEIKDTGKGTLTMDPVEMQVPENK